MERGIRPAVRRLSSEAESLRSLMAVGGVRESAAGPGEEGALAGDTAAVAVADSAASIPHPEG